MDRHARLKRLVDLDPDNDELKMALNTHRNRVGLPTTLQVESLISRLDSRATWQRNEIKKSLVNFGVSAVPNLTKGLEQKNPRIRLGCAYVLTILAPGTCELTETLCEYLKTPLPWRGDVKGGVDGGEPLRALLRLGARPMPILQSNLTSNNPRMSLLCAILLSHIIDKHSGL